MDDVAAPTLLLVDSSNAGTGPDGESETVEGRAGAPVGLSATSPPKAFLRVSRFTVWAASTAAASLSVLSGEPLSTAALCLALSSVLASSLVPPAGRHAWGMAAALPTGFVLLCAWALLWGLAGGTAGFSAWGGRGAALIGILLLTAVTGVVARHRGGSVALVGRDGPGLVGFVTIMGFFAWVVASQPLTLWSRLNASGTDFLRHLGAVRQVRLEGALVLGESGYPTGIHALGAWLTASQGTGASADSLWRSVAPIGFLMLGLVLLGIMVAARRLSDITTGGNLPGVVAAGLAAAVFVQTAWFSTFLAFGNLMNMLAGVCLMALLVHGLQPRSFGTTTGSVVAAAAVGVTANAWQLLLPIVGVAATPWLVAFAIHGRRRWTDWAAWLTGGVLVLNGVLGLRTIDGGGQAAVATVSNLFSPDWWWWVGIAFSMLAIGTAWRRGRRGWSAVAAGMLVSGAALVAGLMVTTDSSWELLRYYPVKALWTTVVVVIPLGSAGAVLLAVSAWRAFDQRPSWARLAVRGTLALIVGITIAGVLGRGAAFRPHLATIADGRAGMPTWSLALLDALRGVEVSSEAEEGTVVFGLVPSTSVGGVTTGFVGMVDYMAMEALGHMGIEGAFDAPVKVGLVQRDMTQVCRYLLDHPDSLRITGPNPAAGAPWIIDSGCPEAVVKPDQWVSLDIDPGWLERSPWEDGQWSYPSFDEVQQASSQG